MIFDGDEGKVYGDQTLTTDTAIPSGKTLTIPEGSTLTIPAGVTLTNKGTITNDGTIAGSGTIAGNKVTPTVTAPTAKTDLIYTGAAQELVTAGSTAGGTLQYSLDNSTWGTNIPAGTDAGNYTVWYKVEEDSEYGGVAAQNLTVTVRKTTPTVNADVSLSGSAGARQAVLTITVTGAANGAAPTGTVTLTGTGLNETLTLDNGTASYTWTGLVDGQYTVTAGYNGDGNYTAVSTGKTFDTNKQDQAALAINDVGSKTYGDPAFTLSTSGGSGTGAVTFTSSDPAVISISGATANILKAGSTTITATKAADGSYNEVTAAPLPVMVGKKTVVFKARDVSVQQGGTMPTFTYETVTLAQGDSITTEPTSTCTTTDTNTVGTFTITFSGAVLTNEDNYEISYQPGTLTVTARSTGGGVGSYTPTTYPPTVERPSEGGGTAAVSPSDPKQGDTVTVTPKPDTGYEVDQIIVTDRNGKPVAVTAKPDGTYTFKQPTGKVKIEVTYKPIESSWNDPFTDVAEGAWYYEAVRFVQERSLMNGYSDGRFGPDDNLSRAQLAQILFNKEDKPVVNYLMQYGDVSGEAWYAEAVRWATSQGIVSGYGNGCFGPNDPITREQLAVMLWRYSGSPTAADKELRFNDVDEISDFALEAMLWAVENSVMNGYGNGQLGPKGLATRAQVAQMLKNFIEK